MKSPSASQERASSMVSRTYTGPPPDEGIFDDKGNVVKRHPWNEEETAALLSGLQNYGLGKWAQIKQEYGYILRNRHSVQLKDKYRNMKKNGELPERFMTEEV
jgi:Myb-like DNA-binding domain